MCHDFAIQIILDGKDQIAEVRYFMQLIVRAADNFPVHNKDLDAPEQFQFDDVALITLYSDHHPYLLEQSYGVLASCTKLGEASLQVIDISTIQSVVAMIPHHPRVHGVAEERYFLVEKMGMEITRFGSEENGEF